MNSVHQLLLLGLCSLLLSACDESTAAGPAPATDAAIELRPDSGQDAGLVLSTPDAAPPNEDVADAEPASNVDMARMPDMESDGGLPEVDATVSADMMANVIDPSLTTPTFIEVKLSPRLLRYVFGQEVTARATVLNTYGDEISAEGLRWSIEPDDRASIADDGTLTFLSVGNGTVKACLDNGLCGQAAFVADDGRPVLNITEPARGASFLGEDESRINVRGTVTDGSPSLSVRVNGERVELDENGAFSTQVSLNFGLNRIIVEADDGHTPVDPNQTGPTTDLRDVLWAPEYLPSTNRGATLERAAAVRVDQALFDSGELAQAVVLGMQEYTVSGLAQLLEIILQITDISQFINVDDLLGLGGNENDDEDDQENDEPPIIALKSLNLGTPEVDFNIAEPGLELLLRLPNITIETEGAIDLQGSQLSLTGTITIAISARIGVSVAVNDEPRLVVAVSEGDDSGVVVESIDADFDGGGLGALLAANGGGIAVEIERLFGEFINNQLRDQISGFVRDALLGLFGNLRDLPLNLDPMIPGVSPLSLVLSLIPAELELRPQHWLRFIMKTSINHAEEIEPRADDPGIPIMAGPAWDARGGRGIGLTLRLGLFNALMHEVWRSGLLNIAIPREQSPLPALISNLSADGKLSPTIAPAPLDNPSPLEIQIGELQLAVSQPTITPCASDDDCEDNQSCAAATSPDGPMLCEWEPDIYTVSLRSGLDIAFTNNNLVLALDEDPDVQGQLIEQRSKAPLAVGLLVAAVKGLVWDQLRDALQNSLDFGLGSVAIDPAVLQSFVPNINAIDAIPTFDENTSYPFGHPLLEGELLIRLGLQAMD